MKIIKSTCKLSLIFVFSLFSFYSSVIAQESQFAKSIEHIDVQLLQGNSDEDCYYRTDLMSIIVRGAANEFLADINYSMTIQLLNSADAVLDSWYNEFDVYTETNDWRTDFDPKTYFDCDPSSPYFSREEFTIKLYIDGDFHEEFTFTLCCGREFIQAEDLTILREHDQIPNYLILNSAGTIVYQAESLNIIDDLRDILDLGGLYFIFEIKNGQRKYNSKIFIP